MRNCNLLRLFALSGFLLLAALPHHAVAQWPTLDISSIKEGISTNIELVKQSKVVTDAMATAGKINAGIGDAKASVSKFAGDNLAKAQEKMKKLQEEKERIEKKKEQYEKIKKDIQEKKEAIEDYKRQAEALKADAQGYIDDAKEMKDAAKDAVSMAKDKVSSVKDDISSASSSVGISSENADLNTTSAVAEAEPQMTVSGRTAFGSVQSGTEYRVAAPTSDAKNYGEAVSETSAVAGISEVAEDDASETDVQALTEEQLKLKEEQEALDKEKAELEVDAMFAKTPEEKAAVEEKMKALDAKYEDLNGRMAENAAQLAAAQEQPAAEATVETPAETKAVPAGRRPFGMPEKADTDENNDEKQPVDEREKDEDKEPQPFHRAKILDGETSTKMEIPESHRAKILDTYEAPVDHTPKILEQSRQQSGNSSGGFRKRAVQRSSALQNGCHYASRSFSETMVFADLAGGAVPDGTVNGVFILSDRLAQECEINVADLEDEKVMDECIKKLVKAKSDNDASIAQEATAVYKTIMQETVNGLIAESMAQKNEAANYETKVLEEMEKKIAQTKNSRDDTGGLSLTNMETQYLLNRILTIYAGQLTLDTLNEVSGFDKSYYQDGDDEETGEEK